MRYIFFGTPEFASIILESLIVNNLPPVALVCNPDRPQGRKQVITSPPTKVAILKHKDQAKQDISIIQPETLNSSFLKIISGFQPDFFVVAAYAKILQPELLLIPRLGSIGIHPSLLPRYRGTTPIQNAILNGDTITGVTLFLLDPGIDTGKILLQESIDINNETYSELMKSLASLSGRMLVRVLPQFNLEKTALRVQEYSTSLVTKKFKSTDAYIDFNELQDARTLGGDAALKIERMIRALNPEPGVYTINAQGKRVKLLAAKLEAQKLTLIEVQQEGKKPTTLISNI